MKKHLKLILVVLLVLSLFGCGAAKNPDTTTATKTVTKPVVSTKPTVAPEVQQALDSLQPAPTSYCISYLINKGFGGFEMDNTDIQNYAVSKENYAPDKTIEYCTDGENSKLTVDIQIASYASVMPFTDFCLGNTNGVFCDDDDKDEGTVCVNDPAICARLHSPFDKVKLTSYPLNNLSYYALESVQLSGGNFQDAKCFKVISATPEQMKEAGFTDEEIEASISQLCYHPQYKQLIYYKGRGMELTVSNYLTPAPAEKFEVPVPIGTKTFEEIKAEINGIAPR